MSIKLRDYQDEAIQAILAARDNGVRRQLVSLATGGGKTLIFSELARRLNVPTLILAHRDELIQQAVDKLLTVWPQANVGIVKAGQDDFRRPIVVASVQTLAREKRLERLAGLPWNLGVIDEAHHSSANSYHNIITRLGFLNGSGETPPDKLLLGVTATPKRGDGIGLHEIFEEIVYKKSILDLIRAGYLVDLKGVQILTRINLGGIKVSRGDFDERELEHVLNTDNANSLVVRAYKQYAADRKAIAFTAGVDHARALAAMFRRAGVPADWVCGETPVEQRRNMLKRYEKGELKILTNFGVLCLDEHTEILTSHGWVGIDDMTYDHKVANWDDGKIFFEEPKFIVRRMRLESERMVVYETKRRSIRVTEDHRMVYRTDSPWAYHYKHAGELVGKATELPVSGYAEPFDVKPIQPVEPEMKRKKRIISTNAYDLRKNNGFSWDDSFKEALLRWDRRYSLHYKDPKDLTIAECQFIGFWIGDGTRTPLRRFGIEYKIAQSMVYPNIINWFDGVIAQTGFHCVRREHPNRGNGVVAWSFPRGTGSGPQQRDGLFPIEPYLDKNGTPLLWGLNNQQFDAFLLGLWYADGNHQKASSIPKAFRIFETNYRLLSLIQAVAVCRGYSASITIGDNHKKNPKYSVLYKINLRKWDVFRLAGGKHTLSFEDGWKSERVWCVTSTTGNIVTRRRGTVVITGNTEGFDSPSTDCIVMARPTKSTSLYCQIIGRGTRTFPGKTDCLVLDVAGVSHRHDVCSLSSLFGLSRERLSRQAVSTAVKQAVDAGEKPKDETGQLILGYDLVSRTIDIFQRSQFRWVVSADTMILTAGPGEDIFLLPTGDGKYRVVLKSKEGQADLAESPLDVGYAQGVAEDYVRARKKRVGFASKDALWRVQRPSQKQIDLLAKLGHRGPIPETAGEVSDLIDQKFAASRVRAVTEDQSIPWQQRPPTEAQVKFIQTRMRSRAPKTRIEAKEMIDQFMARQQKRA